MNGLLVILFYGILTLWVPFRWCLSVFQVALFALAGWRIARSPDRCRSFKDCSVTWLLAGCVAWGLLQLTAGWSVDPSKTQESILDWVTNLVAFWLALNLSCGRQQRERFLLSVVIFTTALAVVSILTVFTSPLGMVFWGVPAGTGLPTLGPFVYRNQYAAFVEAVLPIVIFFGIRDSHRRLLFTLVAAILFGSVLAGGSRAGTALCLTELVAVPLVALAYSRISRLIVVRLILGGILAVAVVTMIVGWETIWSRMQEQHPYAMRFQLVQSSLAMVRDRPWTGFGIGTWPVGYPAYALFDDGLFVNQAHNDWLQWTVEGGIPFVLLLLVTAAWSVRPALQSLWGIGMIAVFLHCFVDYPMQQRPALTAFFFAFLGLLASWQTTGMFVHVGVKEVAK